MNDFLGWVDFGSADVLKDVTQVRYRDGASAAEVLGDLLRYPDPRTAGGNDEH